MQSGLIRMLWGGGLSVGYEEEINWLLVGSGLIRMLWGGGLSVGYGEEINW